MIKRIKVVAAIFALIFCFSPDIYANNLSISNVSLEDRNPSSNTVVVKFDVSWENSWRTKINHDAVWINVRLYDPTQSPKNKKLCRIVESGLNPSGTNTGSNSDIELSVPSDRYGVFIRPSSYGAMSSLSSSDVQLTIDYDSCGFDSSDEVYASVFGIEMVYIPEGSFYAGDYNSSTAALTEGSADSDPWYISSESAIEVSNPASDGYRYVSNNNSGEDASGTSFTIPSSFPKGYGSFYAMKYELTEGQWVEFMNSLPSSNARDNRDVTNSSHKNSDSVLNRNAINCSGSPLTCSSSRPARALSYISWMDLVAFLDWAALRPMTELEFEKMARGPILPVEGEFSWGTTNIIAATTISSGSENGAETITNSGANANYNSVTFTGGDSGNGTNYAKGPLRAGIFATSSTNRISSGSGYYGVMELSGNVKERVVTIGNSTGRNFKGTSGDGLLSTASGYEGNANQADWPGINVNTEKGVTTASGSGFRGGAWDDSDLGAKLRISDRNEAAYASTGATKNSGGRGVRSYDENY